MDFLFSVNESSAAGQTVSGTNVKADTQPVHPGEKPTKAAHILWCEQWRASLDTQGYSACLRGRAPLEVLKLKDRELITDPMEGGKANASIVSKNAEITHENEQKAISRNAIMFEYKTRLASKLKIAMLKKCPLRLKRLQKEHQIKDEHGCAIDDTFDGIAMFIAEEKFTSVGGRRRPVP